MKQEVITYLSTLKSELYELSNFLYKNPEENFHEYKAYDYILNLLKQHHFDITYNYLDIPTAFYAKYGNGHPKICYICKYSCGNSKNNHIYGTNINCSMSIGAALGLSKVIDKTKGSIILLGCPGDNFNGSELTMAKQNVFEDIDIIMAPHADVKNFQSGSSMAIIPMKIEYTNVQCSTYKNSEYYSPLDACLFTFNALSILLKNSCENCSIDGISVQGTKNPYTCPSSAEAEFYIRTANMENAEILQKKIRDFIKAISPLLNVESKICFFNLPSENLITNRELSRLFTHNLKESGIITIEGNKNFHTGLSIGSLSHTTPCIYPSINIAENNNIKFPSKEFGECTLSEYAQDKLIKASEALALTALDIIEKEELLKEITEDLYKNK